MVRLWPKRRQHWLASAPDEAQERLIRASEQAGQAREAHAAQKRARASEAPLRQTMDDLKAGNSISLRLRNAILHADDA